MRVYGHSMRPVLEDGELVIVRAMSHSLALLQKGDLVAVCPFKMSNKILVKRLAGLPRDGVQVQGQCWKLGADQWFLLGDCLDDSLDSRAFGPVSHREIIGRVEARLWPWKRFHG